ncbi:hypothetical protein M446_6978 (plasmid) [Methylobacterium sp. 4-46]|nr:hypothetical protein M446_6978 [Methylobacterium sp. 4-46]
MAQVRVLDPLTGRVVSVDLPCPLLRVPLHAPPKLFESRVQARCRARRRRRSRRRCRRPPSRQLEDGHHGAFRLPSRSLTI